MTVKILTAEQIAPNRPAGGYRAILADPPWSYKVFSKKGEGRSASQHYSTMALADIQAMPVADLAAKDAHLFLWVTTPNLKQGLQVMESWGFTYSSTAFIWVKLNPRAGQLFLMPGSGDSGKGGSFHIGMGHTTRKNAELVLLGRRGSPKRNAKNISELVFSPRREHSRKPPEVIERIERYTDGPYLELFSREARPGWHGWGNETDKFKTVAEAAE